MRARLSIEVDLIDGSNLTDAADLTTQLCALVLLHGDHRVESAEPVGAERIGESYSVRAICEKHAK